MIKNLKRILSYLWPIRIETTSSPFADHLEVTLENGVKVINGRFANYSYGLLRQVFEIAFDRTDLDLKATDQVLILGFGGGSVVKVLREHLGFTGDITGVERDPVVLRLAHKHFPQYVENVNIVEGDAFEFLDQNEKLFDLIIVDLFNDNIPVSRSSTPGFIVSLKNHLTPSGHIYHNLMLGNEGLEVPVKSYKSQFTHVEVLYPLGINEVIVASN